MFFGLVAVDDHPCCRMQEVVESFFENSIDSKTFTMDLFPKWIRATLRNPSCALAGKFSSVHTLLYASGSDEARRRRIYEQVEMTNRIQALCDGVVSLPVSSIDWTSELGKAISALMAALYDALDLAVFRRNGTPGNPTHQLYNEFIEKNQYVCPFCGLERFKNPRGAKRQDFDHYLHKSAYPFAAANMRNLVPACGICNQDYKCAKDVLKDGLAFYPYTPQIPPVKLEVDCTEYPASNKLDDDGKWFIKLDLITPHTGTELKMATWDRVYSIKRRLEDEIKAYFDEWMTEASDNHPEEVDQTEFRQLLQSARNKAKVRAERRMEPKQIIKEAFYEFMLTRANATFVESFRVSRNRALN